MCNDLVICGTIWFDFSFQENYIERRIVSQGGKKMRHSEICKLYTFYQNELKENILHFWLPRCEDRQFGGFVNCFTNSGDKLVSYDKYTWSQGRFVWMFARLSITAAPVFSEEERKGFLKMAQQGAQFLMDHCIIDKEEENWRATFLMGRDGTAKKVSPGDPLDMSIYADCFVIAGLAMYAFASGEDAPYRFARRLYESALSRVKGGDFHTLPYPLSKQFRAHGIPMIFSNVTRELYRAACQFDVEYSDTLVCNLEGFAGDILTHFVDEDNALHEIITEDNQFFPQILGQHMNPGHTIEDVWFLLDAVDICGKKQWEDKIHAVARKALENGWDHDFGGILHFTGIHGGKPEGDDTGVAQEPMTQQLSGWADKLWWIHSEALYSTLLCYFRTGDEAFLDWHDKVFDYTFRVFPNRDPQIREWIQIRKRDGSAQDKVVALPVKDPYHITRNLILILELLSEKL